MPEAADPAQKSKTRAKFRLAPDQGICRLCGTGEPQRKVGPESYARSGQQLRRCGRCAAVYLAPDFQPATFEAFYAEHYRKLFPSETPWLSEERFFAWRGDRVVARKRLARMAPLLSPATRVFEVGSGFGAFLEALSAAGVTDLQASEPDMGSRSRLLGGIGVSFRTGLSAVPPGSLDIVVAFHVLEHLPDPQRFMAELLVALKPGGRAFIEVPNLMGGLATADYVHPAHLTYFTPETLSRLARAAGARLLFCGPHPDGGPLSDNIWLELERPESLSSPIAMDAAPRAEIELLDARLDLVEWEKALRWSWRRSAKMAALRLLGAGAVGEWQRWRQWRQLRQAGWIGNHAIS
jgi:SAM-dependent methyltransferase